ncbi:MAG TPA: ectoine/hydroxyectoine ABC transporter ATP-binding protein EhuA [Spirochaetia bacterium]|nr:ectoine/hydroxyectoine ABC transporter ATP-binding protein EhuA [Spirochaetia bacterium]
MTVSNTTIAEFVDVHKSFTDLKVFNGINFSITRGEKVAIIGPSGSGKSTLLRVLMTLEQVDSGTVKIDGERLWRPLDGHSVRLEGKRLREVRKKVGMVFQHFHLFPHMTALRNVTEAPVQVLKIPKAEARERGMELLHMVGLDDKVDSYPAELSGGQKQRVAIARALAMQPEIMLFDEVTSALDPELVEEVLNVMRKLAEENDLSMIIVTHQMYFAGEIADRISFFDNGVIVEEGPPSELLYSPQEPRTQAFLKSFTQSGNNGS